MIRRFSTAIAVMLPFLYENASASTVGRLSNIPVMLNIIILIGSIACLTVAIRLFGLVKGGALARGWQMLVISFITLTVGQIVVLAEKLDLVTLTFDLAGIMYLATVILWFVSLLQTRKVLG